MVTASFTIAPMPQAALRSGGDVATFAFAPGRPASEPAPGGEYTAPGWSFADAPGIHFSPDPSVADRPGLRLPAADRGRRPRQPLEPAPPPVPASPAAPADAYTQGAVIGSLVVQMLDGFQVWVGAREVTGLPRGKARSLLKYLLLKRHRPVARARLTRLFWPEAEAPAARNSLNVTLHRLRKALGDPTLLVYANDSYQLQPSGAAWIDVEQFLGHAEEGNLAEARGQAAQALRHYELAAGLYCSDLLDDGDTEPALQLETQALRDRLNEVLERLAQLQETQGDPHACLRAAQRHLALDACNESAHQRLMRCYARLGQPQLAERQYRSCVSQLREQLGLPPGEATTQLYRRIVRRDGA